MGKARLEAFSGGVLAIAITIMVLELKVPQGDNFTALRPLVPVFLSAVSAYAWATPPRRRTHSLERRYLTPKSPFGTDDLQRPATASGTLNHRYRIPSIAEVRSVNGGMYRGTVVLFAPVQTTTAVLMPR
jgi:hypothetical protein